MLKWSQNWPVLALQVGLCDHLTPLSTSLSMYVLLWACLPSVERMMHTSEHCLEVLERKRLKIIICNVWHLVYPHQILFLHSYFTPLFCQCDTSAISIIAWLPERILGHVTASRDKPTFPWRVSFSVTAVRGGRCVVELGERQSVIAQLPVNWVETVEHILTPFPCISCAFPILSGSSLVHVLSHPSSSTSEWYGLWAPGKGQMQKNWVWCQVCQTGSWSKNEEIKVPLLGHFRKVTTLSSSLISTTR